MSGGPVILCFGDSNTHGSLPVANWTARGRQAPGDRWTSHLAAALPGATIIPEGQPGRTTVFDDPVEGVHKNGLAALPVILESHRPIDLVILMLGTNDCKTRFSATALDIARGVDRLLAMIAGSGAGPGGGAPGVLLVAPAPIAETGILREIFAGGAEKSRGLAKHLAEVAAARGAWFLDAGLHADVCPEDGIHLTADAHSALAHALAPLVKRYLAHAGDQGRTTC